MKPTLRFPVLWLLILAMSCTTKESLKPGEGHIKVNGGDLWYRVIGDGDKTPIVLLHGGPGYPSYYLNPLADLSHDRPVIFYDQLGCGRSGRITDTTLMTIDHHMEQLRQLLAALNIKSFYLYGHSWGTMLGIDYYFKYPEGIKAMILASPALSTDLWLKDADALITTLPDTVQNVLRQLANNVALDSIKVSDAINVYYTNFLIRSQPSPDFDSTLAGAALNIYEYMWGPGEFAATGTLKNYERTGNLNKVKIPTLYTAGEFDEARPNTVKYYQSLTPGSKFILIKNAAHLTMHDNPEENVKVISEFLNELESD